MLDCLLFIYVSFGKTKNMDRKNRIIQPDIPKTQPIHPHFIVCLS